MSGIFAYIRNIKYYNVVKLLSRWRQEIELKPDPSLIRAWEDRFLGRLPMGFPYVSAFNRASKQLHFLAAAHGGSVDSPTLRTVQREFDKFRPDVVIVEGMPDKDDVSPAQYLDHCRNQARFNYAQGGESAYAVVLAADRKKHFVTGEPSEKAFFDGFIERGYADSDAWGWHVLCNLKHAATALNAGNQEDCIQDYIDSRLAEIVERHIQVYCDSYLASMKTGRPSFGPQEFYDWYETRTGRSFSLVKLMQDNLSPSSNPDAGFFRNMAAASDTIRDPHLLQVIADQLGQHKKVLVVYGGAHDVKQKDALSQMLGQPRHMKPF